MVASVLSKSLRSGGFSASWNSVTRRARHRSKWHRKAISSVRAPGLLGFVFLAENLHSSSPSGLLIERVRESGGAMYIFATSNLAGNERVTLDRGNESLYIEWARVPQV